MEELVRLTAVGIVIVLGLVAGCRTDPGPHAPDVGPALQTLLEAAVADPAVPGAVLHVSSPRLGIQWSGAVGFAHPPSGTPMTPATPVRIASNTKTYVAAAVLRLAEEGRLALDDAIADHLPAEHAALLEGDGYDPRAITVRHLLTHTGGLFDHTSVGRFEEAILDDPARFWTREEQLQAAMDWGDPHAAPGEVYTYCDTGYVLLGEVVEQASGLPLATAVRDLLRFDELGLGATWWELFESAPPGVSERAHQHIGELDTFDFNPSFDLYGGGGIVATTGDLAAFWRALFGGAVYRDPASLVTMLTTVGGAQALPDADPGAQPPGAYRMGLWELDIHGFTAYRHTGFWGTSATFVPELDLVVTATVNQHEAKERLEAMTAGAVAVVADAAAARG